MRRLQAHPSVSLSLLSLKKFATSNNLPTWVQWVLGILILNSLALCAAHYFQFRSLWLDEAFVAVNVRDQPLLSLFSEYEHRQQFPRLYLSLIWMLQAVIGYEVWVLRLLPFLFGIGAILLWAIIIIDEFASVRSRILVLCALLLFLTNHFLYHFAGEFKQFTWDLFFSGFAVWWVKKRLVPAFEKPFASWIGVAFIAALPILWSWSYTFVLFALIISYFFKDMISFQWSAWSRLGSFALLCIASFIGAWNIDLIHSQYGDLTSYWSEYFIQGSSIGEWVTTFWMGINRVIGRWWIDKITPGLTLLALVAFGSVVGHLIRKKPTPPLVRATGVILLVLVGLAIAQKYPMQYGRTTFFFFPFAVITIVHGINYLLGSKWKVIQWGGQGAIVVVLMLTVLWKVPKVSKEYYNLQHFENINPAIAALDASKSKTVVYGSGTVVQVQAFPHIPDEFTYVHLKDVDLDQMGKEFYFLVATPVGQLAPLTEDLKARSYERSTVVPRQLYYFKK